MSDTQSPEAIYNRVRERYGAIAEGKAATCCGGTSGCSADPAANAERVAQIAGYSALELASLPEGVNLGLSCGNPHALASLKEGDVVLDLGAGAGFDVFLAGRAVGAKGKAIGVDMTPAMLSKSRKAIDQYRQRSGLNNVEFRLGEIEALPLANESVDVVISNCVLNLSPDKPRVWREIFRVLKRGGRVAVSDLALRESLPAAVQKHAEALGGCLSGAALIEDTYRWAQQAGFTEISVQYKEEYIESYASSSDSPYASTIEALPPGRSLSDYVVSINLSALKQSVPCCSAENKSKKGCGCEGGAC